MADAVVRGSSASVQRDRFLRSLRADEDEPQGLLGRSRIRELSDFRAAEDAALLDRRGLLGRSRHAPRSPERADDLRGEYATAGARSIITNLRRTIGAVDAERGVEWSLRGAPTTPIDVFRGSSAPSTSVRAPARALVALAARVGRQVVRGTATTSRRLLLRRVRKQLVDYVARYRSTTAFPARRSTKSAGPTSGGLEWTLPPGRFRRFGVTGLYSNWARLALFGGGLVTNVDADDSARSDECGGADRLLRGHVLEPRVDDLRRIREGVRARRRVGRVHDLAYAAQLK